ncbi:MAG TPA: LCP family protein, partial [Acidimicrobiales bacterium]|nr:LCP family protein [Acidimicrobiales bacterium]
GRIERQQDFIRRVMKKAVSLGWTRPDKVPGVVNNLVKNVSKDEYLGFDDAVSLARRFKSLDAAKVEMLSLPVFNTNHGGAATLDLKQPDADEIIARFNGTAGTAAQVSDPALPKPAKAVVASTVRVRVLNGSGVGGRATEVTNQLRQAGFNTTTPGDADSFRYIRTVVSYAPGQKNKALFLASLMKKSPQLKEDRTLKGLDAHVIVGTDWAGLNAKAGAGATATSTSAPTTTIKPGAKSTTTTAPVSAAGPGASC